MIDDRGWLEAVRRIVTALHASDVAEFELAHGTFHIRVVRDLSATTSEEPATATEPASSVAHLHQVRSPLTGLFYRAPTPAARSYVNEGDWVDVDSVIGLIETMKVFNEVTADRAGRIVAFRAESGQLVSAGEVLVELEPAVRTAAAPEAER